MRHVVHLSGSVGVTCGRACIVNTCVMYLLRQERDASKLAGNGIDALYDMQIISLPSTVYLCQDRKRDTVTGYIRICISCDVDRT